jgi:hypothetical protein
MAENKRVAPYLDEEGNEIHEGDNVWYEGDLYEVRQSLFSRDWYLNNDGGIIPLARAYTKCILVVQD